MSYPAGRHTVFLLCIIFFALLSCIGGRAQDTLRTTTGDELIGSYLGYSFGYMKLQSQEGSDHMIEPSKASELILANGIHYNRFVIVKGELYMSSTKFEETWTDEMITQQLLEKSKENLNAASVLIALGLGATVAGVFIEGNGGIVAGIVGGVSIIGSQITTITGAQKTRKALEKQIEVVY